MLARFGKFLQPGTTMYQTVQNISASMVTRLCNFLSDPNPLLYLDMNFDNATGPFYIDYLSGMPFCQNTAERSALTAVCPQACWCHRQSEIPSYAANNITSSDGNATLFFYRDPTKSFIPDGCPAACTSR
jgi:hypothetical protein